MDRYQRVEKPKEETPINENEIRITAQGRMRNYISYATSLLQDKGSNEIVFKAMGRAINKTVMIVELIKRRIVGLHQNTSIGSTDITDTWEPLEEGLLPLETTRHVSMITITLSKEKLDVSVVGYQSPVPVDQVKQWTEFEYEGEGSPAVRGRGRGGRGGRGRARGFGGGNVGGDYDDGGWDNRERGYNRGGWNRGRGRNFRGGRGTRGWYGGRGDYHQNDAGGYHDEVVAPVRGGRRGGYGGRGDYHQNDAGGYHDEVVAPVRGGRRGGYGGRGDYHQYDAGGYHDEVAPPVRGRGRGRGRGQNRGGGRVFRSNGPMQAVPGEV